MRIIKTGLSHTDIALIDAIIILIVVATDISNYFLSLFESEIVQDKCHYIECNNGRLLIGNWCEETTDLNYNPFLNNSHGYQQPNVTDKQLF